MLLTRSTRSLAVAAFLLTAATAALSQTATGTLSGVVHDAGGGLLGGAMVTARNQATGETRRIATDQAGRYSIAGLPPGEYEVRVELTGFATRSP